MNIYNLAWTEAVWIAISLIGITATWPNLRGAMRDLADLRRLRMNGAKGAVLQYSVTTQRAILFCMFVALGIGLFAASLPPIVRGDPITPVTMVVTVGLILIVGRLSVLSLQGVHTSRAVGVEVQRSKSERADRETAEQGAEEREAVDRGPGPQSLIADTGETYARDDAK